MAGHRGCPALRVPGRPSVAQFKLRLSLLVVLGLLGLVLVPSSASAAFFYLPGVPPQEYRLGDPIPIKVNSLTSVQTQYPVNYYDLPFCRPPGGPKHNPENFFEELSGDRLESSLYSVNTLQTQHCRLVCAPRLYSRREMSRFSEKIADSYRVNWVLDNLPAVTKYWVRRRGQSEPEAAYAEGFWLGFVGEDNLPGTQAGIRYVNNHADITVLYHEDPASYEGVRIVGIEVEPRSVRHVVEGEGSSAVVKTCPSDPSVDLSTLRPQPVSGSTEPLEIAWTYSVRWKQSDVSWASRWDVYLKMTNSDIHWIGIGSSILLVLLGSAAAITVLLRTVHRDLLRYEQLWARDRDLELQGLVSSSSLSRGGGGGDSPGAPGAASGPGGDSSSPATAPEESGWRLVHTEVFRPPARGGSWLAVLIGSGVQICAMALLTLVFALLGFLSPANRGALATALVLSYVFMSLLAGYASTRLYTFLYPSAAHYGGYGYFGGANSAASVADDDLEDDGLHRPASLDTVSGLKRAPASAEGSLVPPPVTWKRNALRTALLFPGVLFGIVLVLDVLTWGWQGRGVVSAASLFPLFGLWLGVGCPLVYLGARAAAAKPPIEAPLPYNELPRLLPPSATGRGGPWWRSRTGSMMLGGLIPFLACFVELFYMLGSLWQHQFYYLFPFLFVVFLVLVATSAQVGVVAVYLQLTAENYHWWWRAFAVPASSAAYVFLYSAWYFATKLHIEGFTPAALYFGYTLVVCLGFALLTGTAGFLASWWFVRKIYSNIKVD